MNDEVKNYIQVLLETIQEGLDFLKTENNQQIKNDICEAKKCIESALEQELNCSLSQRININALNDQEWVHTIKLIIDETENPFIIKNQYDKYFMRLIHYLWKSSEEQMVSVMKKNMEQLKKSSEETYRGFVYYFERFPLWGKLYPQQNNYETLELRAATLKRRSYDFIWLYKQLEDYLSKRTLYAVLINWAVLDFSELVKVKSIFPDYYEPDIFTDNKDDIFVDVGAFIGDSIQSYISAYGTSYKKIYAYEISKESCEQIKINTQNFHDIIICQKGLGSKKDVMYIEKNQETSANKLSKNNEDEKVDIVTLDEDIKEKVTFIKMDIEGAEQGALLGCRNKIQTDKPKLAICTYHGYEDIWKIPQMIYEMNPNYKFYMRHNGGNLIPTEFVLLCK